MLSHHMILHDLKFVVEDRIAVIQFNRQQVLNALRTVTLKEIYEVMKRVENDSKVAAVILTGSGRAFSSGADIKEVRNMGPNEARRFARLAHRAFGQIEGSSKPVIAAVNGFALGGGCDLALVCDLCIASEDAVFGEPTAALGIVTAFGGTARLPRVVGVRRAKEMFLLGKMLNAEEAERVGLVNKVVKRKFLLREAKRLARKLLEGAPFALTSLKQLVNSCLSVGLREADVNEIESFARCFETLDQKEGMLAFLEKRSPKFMGR